MKNNVWECKACGNNLITRKYDMNDWEVWRCNGCGFVFAYPLRGVTFDGCADDADTVETHHVYRDELMLAARKRVSELEAFLGDLNGLTVLDVGCGNGYFLQCCKEQGMTAQGLEINEAAARYARSELGISVVVSPPHSIRIFLSESPLT